MEEPKKNNKLFMYFIYIIIAITIVLWIERIFFYFVSPDNKFLAFLIEGRDADFKYLLNLMDIDITKFYDDLMQYLYFWYFIFIPFKFIPVEIGLFIWDGLRLVTIIFIVKNIHKLSDDKQDIIIFYLITVIGYFVDMSINNTNWLNLFLIFESIIQLNKGRKILSGICFTIAMYKILLVIFPFVLILSKKIKLKDLVYYFLPLAIICIPYLIYPQFTAKFIENLTASDHSDLLYSISKISWQIFQPGQLLFMGFITLIFLTGIEHYNKIKQYKKQIRCIVFISIVFCYVILEIILISLPFV